MDVSQPIVFNIHQNYVCTLDGYDFVEQFVEHYFTNFDSLNRYNTLKGMYHPNAVLTMSTNTYGLSDINGKSMSRYSDRSRNLIRSTNTNPLENVYQGPEKIASLLAGFPQTDHDFKSFCIDLTVYSVSSC